VLIVTCGAQTGGGDHSLPARVDAVEKENKELLKGIDIELCLLNVVHPRVHVQ